MSSKGSHCDREDMKKGMKILCDEYHNVNTRSNENQKEGIDEAAVLQVCSVDLWESSGPFQGISQVKNHFYNNIKILSAFHYIDICTNGTKAMVANMASALA